MAQHVLGCVTAFLVAVIMATPAAVAETPQTPVAHRPIEPQRDEQQRAVRNAINSVVTPNWSGYAVAQFQTSLSYSSASATWQIPDVKWGSTTGNPTGYEYNSIWVGIGGYCKDAGCASVDQTLIQLGSEQIVNQSGTVTNYLWYELYPAVSQSIPHSVSIGDIITASLECTANCTPNQAQTWHLAITDETQGWTWTTDVSFKSSMLSAEWIVEAPYYNGYLPLNNFTQVNFSPVVANGNNPNLSLTSNSIIAQDPYGQTANPSTPNNGDWFGSCWGYQTLTACTAQSFSGSPTPVSVSLTTNPSTIKSGQASTLTWDSSGATSCAANGFSGSGTVGSVNVYPTSTTTYSITCSGNADSATAYTTVRISKKGRL